MSGPVPLDVTGDEFSEPMSGNAQRAASNSFWWNIQNRGATFRIDLEL